MSETKVFEDIRKSWADLHAKVDRMATRSDCKVKYHDGGTAGNSFLTCETHPSGTPWCRLNSTALDVKVP